jgi:hypothetical protein
MTPMMNYDHKWFDPPAPMSTVVLRNCDSGESTHEVPMLLDTGADATLIPRASIATLGDVIAPGKQYELMAFDGRITIAPVARLELHLLHRKFRGYYLIVDQDWGILGRYILNSLVLLLDGPQQLWSDHRPVRQPY